MHTLSGRRFEIGDGWVPTFKDVAFSLSRLPRWGGATLVTWSVLHHSLSMYRLALKAGAKHDVLLALLWHDADEMATGDIPKPFKTAEQSALAETLRQWFYRTSLQVPYPDDSALEVVKFLDHEARIAEVHCFCHPRTREDFDGFEVPMDLVDVMWDLFTEPLDHLIEEFIRATEVQLIAMGRRL